MSEHIRNGGGDCLPNCSRCAALAEMRQRDHSGQINSDDLYERLLDRDAQVAALTADNERLRAEMKEQERDGFAVIKNLTAQVTALTAENERLRGMLGDSLGADPNRWPDAVRRENERLRAEVERLKNKSLDDCIRHADGVAALGESLVRTEAERDALRLDLARVTEERELAKADARILAHAYTHDSRPPQSIVDRALAHKGDALRAASPQKAGEGQR